MSKAITVMLDDVLNNFSEMLSDMGISFDAERESILNPRLADAFFKQSGELSDVAKKVMGETAARQDGVEFLKWLKENGWTVVLCTNRDIRLCYNITKKWLDGHKVMYDYLFTATTPAGLCIDMDIAFLVYNLPKGNDNHINAVSFYQTEDDCHEDHGEQKQPVLLGDFQTFEEVKHCILKTSY